MPTARTGSTTSALGLLVRSSIVPTLGTALVCAGLFALRNGSAGLFGAALGCALVVGFFGLGRVTLEVMRVTDAATYLIIALLTYGLQVVALLALFAGFGRHPAWEQSVSTTALGVTVIASTLVWTAGLVVASRLERSTAYDLEIRPR